MGALARVLLRVRLARGKARAWPSTNERYCARWGVRVRVATVVTEKGFLLLAS